jgi:hypothetical protein
MRVIRKRKTEGARPAVRRTHPPTRSGVHTPSRPDDQPAAESGEAPPPGNAGAPTGAQPAAADGGWHADARGDAPSSAAAPAQRQREHLREEARMRASGGPDDRALYTCACGYAFEADVTASVICPHCGAGQAW